MSKKQRAARLMKQTVDQLLSDPLCGICGQPYREHKAFMENCPLLAKGEFCADVYFVKKDKPGIAAAQRAERKED